MSIKNLFLILLLVVPSVAMSDELQLRSDHPDQYVVVKGDTLWDISGHFLEKPWRWPEIWQGNPQIENPHLIYPGDVITLGYVDGKPVLSINGGGELSLGGRDVKLSPSTREYQHDKAIPPIPLDAIYQFLSRPRVVTEDELEAAPYIVSSYDEHLVAGSGTKIYVRGITGQDVTRFSIYRQGDAYIDGGTGEILGYEAMYVGDAVLQRTGDPASLMLISTAREVLIGDRLLPVAEEVDPLFIPHAPQADVNGHIISAVDAVSQIGQLQVVVLDRGTQDGLEAGHVLAISQTGKIVRDYIGTESDAKTLKRVEDERKANHIDFERADEGAIDGVLENLANDVVANINKVKDVLAQTDSGVDVELPEERIGELMVFRLFDRVSYALVMKIQRPVHLMDSVSNP